MTTDYQAEYYQRKARRVLETSKNATRCGTVTLPAEKVEGGLVDVEIRKDYRSKGYRSGYDRTLTYWLISRNHASGELIYGTSYTPSAYAKECAAMQKQLGVTLPS